MANRRDGEGDGAGETRNDLVLLVDDDPVARLLTASALAERQWRVIEADGGGHALELFAEQPARRRRSRCADAGYRRLRDV